MTRTPKISDERFMATVQLYDRLANVPREKAVIVWAVAIYCAQTGFSMPVKELEDLIRS